MTTKHILPTLACVILPLSMQAEKRPNIILINIDDLGWTDLSCQGSGYYETPNIDRLRAEGVWFGQAYAGSANSAPSRACLLTGQYPPRHGVYTVGTSARGKESDRNMIPVPNKETLDADKILLPQVLKEAGYQTCHIGKWHVTEDPRKSGMDINIGGNHAGNPNTYFAPYNNPDLKDGPDGEYLTDRLGDEAVAFLRSTEREKPFFLYYATYEVHTPLQAEAKLIDKYMNKLKTSAHFNPVYAAMVEAMDRNVGKVLDAVRSHGIEKETLIIFTSDNGGVYKISHQWPLRAGKGSFYEGGIRVPLIIYQKDRFEQSSINDVVVSQLDLFPTLMTLAGSKRTDLTLDGISLLPLLNGKKKGFNDRAIFWHFPAYLEGDELDAAESGTPHFRTRPVSVVRKGDWKLKENYETSTLELYNIKEDISEKTDISSINPKKTKELYKLLTNWKKELNAPLPTPK